MKDGDTDMTIFMYHNGEGIPGESRKCVETCHTCRLKERKDLKPIEEEIKVSWTTIVPDSVTPEGMEKDQILDEDIMPILVAVQDGNKPHFQEIVGCNNRTRTLWHQFNSLEIRNKLLYRRFEHPSGPKEKNEYQLILPRKHIKNTIKSYHEQLGVGNHFGISKTIAYLQRFFWWPGMFNDVIEHITNCHICTKFKGPKKLAKVPFETFPRRHTPREVAC